MNCPNYHSGLPESAVYCDRCGALLRRAPAPPRYAGFWRRVAAVLIDLMFVGSPVFYLNEHLVQSTSPEGQLLQMRLLSGQLSGLERQQAFVRLTNRVTYFFLITTFVCAIYFIPFESSRRQGTFGKFFLGLKVTDLNGLRISRRRAARRFFARFLSALPWQFGFAMAGFTRRKQALHDLVAGTVVVRSDEYGTLSGIPGRMYRGILPPDRRGQEDY